MAAKSVSWKEQPDGYLDRTPVLQFVLVSILFAMWAIASSLNDILITQFKVVFNLSDLATAFVQSAFYGGYFIIAIPASLFIKKSSYKMGIIAGLACFAAGCFIFFPASRMATYAPFLFAIFVEAIGLSFLETSGDTYATLLGPRRLATVRLNIAQVMNAVGLIIGILLGKYLIFQDSNLKTEMAKMTPEAAHAYGIEQLGRTLSPYKYVLIVLIVLILAFAVTKFPSGRPKTAEGADAHAGFGETITHLLHNRRYWGGVATQFIYIGAQTGIWSFTMRLALNMFPHFTERDAADFMLWSYGFFLVGRFLASWLLTKFRETRVLSVYMILGTLMLLGTVTIHSVVAVWMAAGVSLFLGPGWPTIYSRTLETVEDRRYTETAGAIIVMAIVGGAVLPAAQGALSDAAGMKVSFILPAIELLIVAIYFLFEMRHDKLTPKQKRDLALQGQAA
jgi:FHS family L-fucose permease-like MFS transporter